MLTQNALAEIRTELANQRTLLAYIRTALASLSVGIAVIQFIGGNLLLTALGIVLILFAAISIVMGIISYRKYKETDMHYIPK